MNKVSITTIDNPYNPFDDFNNWFLYDCEKGYYTCNKLARLSKDTESMTQKEEDEAVEEAIDKIIEIDPFNIYKKIFKEIKKDSNDNIIDDGTPSVVS